MLLLLLSSSQVRLTNCVLLFQPCLIYCLMPVVRGSLCLIVFGVFVNKKIINLLMLGMCWWICFFLKTLVVVAVVVAVVVVALVARLELQIVFYYSNPV